MFLPSSRYARVDQVDVAQGGASPGNARTVSAVKFRRLPVVSGNATVVKGNDHLDVIALRLYNDATQYWHVADANTELRANDLLDPPGRVINVPAT